VLGECVVDRNDRVLQGAGSRHRLEADNAGRRLLRAADHILKQVFRFRVEHRDDIGAVVHGDVRLYEQRILHVTVVGLGVLALDRKDSDTGILDERCSHVVLRAERIRRAERNLRTTRLQRLHQHCRLGRHVEAGNNIYAFQRLFLAETILDALEHRHFLRSPFDAECAFFCQCNILYVKFCHQSSRFLLCFIFFLITDY